MYIFLGNDINCSTTVYLEHDISVLQFHFCINASTIVFDTELTDLEVTEKTISADESDSDPSTA